MTYTTHGHHIWGTIMDKERPTSIVRCGGPKICTVCAKEFAAAIEAKKTKKTKKTKV